VNAQLESRAEPKPTPAVMRQWPLNGVVAALRNLW